MVNVAAAAPMGSNSAKSVMEGVTKGWGKNSHEGSKRCLLLLSPEVQKSLKTWIPVPTKSRCCPIVLFVPWQHDWSWYVNELPSVHQLHSIFTMCCVVLDKQYCYGSVEQNQPHAITFFLMLHRTALEVLCGLSVPFLLMSFGEGLELTYFLCPLGNIIVWDHSTLLCTFGLQESPAFSKANQIHGWRHRTLQAVCSSHSHQRRSTQRTSSWTAGKKLSWAPKWYLRKHSMLSQTESHISSGKALTQSCGSVFCFLWLAN